MLTFTQSMPMIALVWLPDMACYLRRLDQRRYRRLVPAYASAAVGWATALSAAGIATTEQIPWTRALPAVIVADLASAVASGTAVVIR